MTTNLYLRADGAVLDYASKQPIAGGAWSRGVCWLTGHRRRSGPYTVCEATVQAADVDGRCRIRTADLGHGALCAVRGKRQVAA